MLGPVFNAEMLRAGRRGRAHVLRWIYGGWLCLQLFYISEQARNPLQYGVVPPGQAAVAAGFARHFVDLVLGQQFLLIVLVTPAFVAGAITDEKTRGTLQNLLTAHVTPADIVLGKLCARCAQVGALALTPLPLLAVIGPLAGAPPEFLVALIVVTALVLYGLGGVSLLASVWTRQTRTAVITTYATIIGAPFLASAIANVGWLSLPGDWGEAFDPVRPLMPVLDRADPSEAVRRLRQAAVAWGGLGVLTMALAVWRLRPAYLRQLEARPRARLNLGRLASRPRPTRDVMAWKECYIGRRVPLWLGVLVVAALAGGVTALALATPTRIPTAARDEILIQNGFWAMLLATLIVGVRCSGSITGERERQTWDGLMTTPLTVQELVRGKLRGVLRSTWPYVLAYWFGAGLIATMLMARDWISPVVALLIGLGAAGLVVWRAPRYRSWAALGLVLLVAGSGGLETGVIAGLALGVTWLLMYFLGAVGLWCSARSRSSWRSLLATIAVGYAGGFGLFCVSVPVGCIATMIMWVVTTLLGELFKDVYGGGPAFVRALQAPMQVFFAVGSATIFWLVARSIIIWAENTVAKTDRMPPDWVRMIEFDQSYRGRSRRPRPRLPR